MKIDLYSMSVVSKDKRIYLTPKEFGILLVLQPGSRVKKETMERKIWPDEIGYRESLRVHIYKLRKKMRPLGWRIYFQKSLGYILKQDTR